jgi:hypothetical protein
VFEVERPWSVLLVLYLYSAFGVYGIDCVLALQEEWDGSWVR